MAFLINLINLNCRPSNFYLLCDVFVLQSVAIE
eukprot:CAMPEP_0198111588 /NCGR_PEP_ID=MMETSP1442-20131203/3549_1 /TAXON_ID= /ORGANISM="Craspedostauros australis, Strain CCMP3328" /LENGTH=32 /DNA_ID= /DNA_START= /DNA_END= /DNA_ORIENTATION=